MDKRLEEFIGTYVESRYLPFEYSVFFTLFPFMLFIIILVAYLLYKDKIFKIGTVVLLLSSIFMVIYSIGSYKAGKEVEEWKKSVIDYIENNEKRETGNINDVVFNDENMEAEVRLFNEKGDMIVLNNVSVEGSEEVPRGDYEFSYYDLDEEFVKFLEGNNIYLFEEDYVLHEYDYRFYDPLIKVNKDEYIGDMKDILSSR